MRFARARTPRARSWVFLFPIGNLVLTKDLNREFRVDRVTFVHRDKLPYIRRRLGLGAPVSDLKKKVRYPDFLESADAFAVVRESGDLEEVKRRCLGLVREELSILTLSQLGYSKRKRMVPIALFGEDIATHIRYLGVHDRGYHQNFPGYAGATLRQVGLGGRWKTFQNEVFFTGLLKILRGGTGVDNSWRKELRRASIIIGESVGANDLLKSFLWNMVALEMLLTKQEERVREALPRRAEALLGWVGFWEEDGYEARVRRVYGERNRFLHSGRREGITAEDLAFTDELLVNLLTNLVKHPKIFTSKAAILEFSERVEAERKLGVKPKVRPGSLQYTRSL